MDAQAPFIASRNGILRMRDKCWRKARRDERKRSRPVAFIPAGAATEIPAFDRNQGSVAQTVVSVYS